METLIITSEMEIKAWLREIVRSELRLAAEQARSGPSSVEESLLTRKEIAAYLHISLVTLTDWMHKGLPCIRKGGRVLFLKSEVLTYLKPHRHPSKPNYD